MRDAVTNADLDSALEAHIRTLAGCGITYEGRLVIDPGSKVNGIAFRLAMTDYPRGDGTRSSGHARPPVGDDYLGMTKREAYDRLTERTFIIGETWRALQREKS